MPPTSSTNYFHVQSHRVFFDLGAFRTFLEARRAAREWCVLIGFAEVIFRGRVVFFAERIDQ
jgi:hypothetical protein